MQLYYAMLNPFPFFFTNPSSCSCRSPASILSGSLSSFPAISFREIFGCARMVFRIIPLSLPYRKHFAERRPGEGREIRERCDELRILRRNPLHLRLLEHDLRDQDMVRIIRVAPWKIVAAVLTVVLINNLSEMPDSLRSYFLHRTSRLSSVKANL